MQPLYLRKKNYNTKTEGGKNDKNKIIFLSDGQNLKIEKSVSSEYTLIGDLEKKIQTLFWFLDEFLHCDPKTKGHTHTQKRTIVCA